MIYILFLFLFCIPLLFQFISEYYHIKKSKRFNINKDDYIMNLMIFNLINKTGLPFREISYLKRHYIINGMSMDLQYKKVANSKFGYKKLIIK